LILLFLCYHHAHHQEHRDWTGQKRRAAQRPSSPSRSSFHLSLRYTITVLCWISSRNNSWPSAKKRDKSFTISCPLARFALQKNRLCAQATGVLVALAFGGGLSLGLLVGFVTIVGVTLRNSLLMIAHYDDLILVERMTWGVEAAVHGATERLA
jgi:hypothetical protein